MPWTDGCVINGPDCIPCLWITITQKSQLLWGMNVKRVNGGVMSEGLWIKHSALNTLRTWRTGARTHAHACSTQGLSPGRPNSTLQSQSCQPSASLSKICTTACHQSWKNERLLWGALQNKSSISEISREYAGGFSLADAFVFASICYCLPQYQRRNVHFYPWCQAGVCLYISTGTSSALTTSLYRIFPK